MDENELRIIQAQVIQEQLKQLKQQNAKESIKESFNQKWKNNLQYVLPWAKIAAIMYMSMVAYQVYQSLSGGVPGEFRLPGTQGLQNFFNWIVANASINTLLAVPVFFVYALLAGIIYFEGHNIVFFAIGGYICFMMFLT